MSNVIRYIIVALFFGLLTVRAWRAAPVEFGDGREYIIQTQAIVFDRAIAVDPQRRGAYWNETNPYGVTLHYKEHATPPKYLPPRERDQYGGGFGSLYPSRSGAHYFVHPWVYSAAVAPLYALFHAVAPGTFEYRAFLVANVFFLFLPLILLLRHSNTWRTFVFLGCICSSPLTPYLQWSHTELFCFFCIMMGFVGLLSQRWRKWSVLFLGLGAAQNIPLVLFFPLHFLLATRNSNDSFWNVRALAQRVLPYSIAALFPAVVAIVSYVTFDTWNLLSTLGQADVSYLSLRKVASVFISPMIGSLWYFPAATAAVLLTVCVGRKREVALCLVAVVCAATISSTTANINSAQLSAPRYAVWFLAPLYVLPFYSEILRKRWSMVGWWCGAVTVVVCLGTLWWLGTYRCLKGDWRYLLSSPNRLRPEIAALYRWSHLHDDIEPIVESIRGQELRFPHDFRGIYVWNLGDNKSLWIVSKRAYQNLKGIEVEFAAEGEMATESLLKLFSPKHLGARTFALEAVRGVRFDRHPYYGGYHLLWVTGDVSSLRGRLELFVR